MDTVSSQGDSSSERKLVAILFVDIQGYPALMQQDESRATILLKRFQKELTREVSSQNGHILQFYGDGALCTVESSKRIERSIKKIDTELLDTYLHNRPQK